MAETNESTDKNHKNNGIQGVEVSGPPWAVRKQKIKPPFISCTKVAQVVYPFQTFSLVIS